ncbi:KRRI-Interacting protein 1 [Agyrium rufum]|nr:KRRI-Interacting protein 1 [Agyrium rufum]
MPSVDVRPAKRMKLFDEEDSASEVSSGASRSTSPARGDGEDSQNNIITVNAEFARRYEHNEKRKELHQLQEKYGDLKARNGHPHGTANGVGRSDSETSDSESEEEDDAGDLASGKLDEQFQATLAALRKKDPRLYDATVKFYDSDDENGDDSTTKEKKAKPMYLSDYHRQNLLNGVSHVDDDVTAPPTYVQEQDRLKKDIVREMHAAADASSSEGEQEQADDFLVKKNKEPGPANNELLRPHIITVDPNEADRDPETFLQNYLTAKAWIPGTASKFQPFESDDEEEDRKAEAFEEAYNLRFEDPSTLNEKLVTHARDTAAKFSVRRESANPRKRARETEQSQKQAEKEERDQEKARLRSLKIEENEERLRKIKEAAGLRGQKLKQEEWTRFLDEGWDDEKWDEEMTKRFGEDYYADHDVRSDDDEDTTTKRKVKKPKWNDDIEIQDLVPDYNPQDSEVSLSEESGEEQGPSSAPSSSSRKRKADRAREESDRKKEARKDRRIIEQLVDQNLDVDFAVADGPSSDTKASKRGRFRYRETSPVSYGLTSRDILLADDSQLNQYVGLKKMATFRDEQKKRKDRKLLGKKARLRQWRKETFGDENGPRDQISETTDVTNGKTRSDDANGEKLDVVTSGKKRKRSKKKNKQPVA